MPLHLVELTCKFVSGKIQIAVRAQLLIPGIDLILGNDQAGEKVLPSPR